MPSLSCSGTCPCTPWVGLNGSTISSNSEGSPQYGNNADCTWTISGLKPQVTFGSFATEAWYDKAYLDECVGGECTSLGASLAVLDGQQEPGLSYESSTSHLRIYLTSNGFFTASGFTATVSGGPPGCTPCRSGTYKAASNASGCTACPTNAVSAEASTALSSCVCAAGYTGDAEVGDDCVACEAGTYKDVSGAATCTACPSNTVSAEASTALISCECPAGYTGDAGVGEDCVPCETGTYKDVSGSATCTACPSNAVSAQGSTTASSCACPAGYTVAYTNISDSAACSACPAGTYKPFGGPGACMSCPGDAGSVEGASSCTCGAGHVFVVPKP